jgi:NAD(P)-dependent dehydrogenase (short-subunit alcohol dehydrogenase family)
MPGWRLWWWNYGMAWTLDDIPDLTGTRAMVTGATSGIGYHTALELLRHGAEVVVAVRDTAKGAGAADDMAAATGRPRPAVVELDLADLASVRSAAASVLNAYDGLNVLVNNAGVMATPQRSTADGFELQVGTNYLGHYALTGLLLPILGDARVVTISSTVHRMARGIGPDDFRATDRYQKWDAYGKSKLANLLFMYELDRRAKAAGLSLLSVGAHPGYAVTHLQTSGPRMSGTGIEQRLISAMTAVVGQSAAHGAWPSLYAATKPGLPGGSYAGPRFGWRGAPRLTGSSRVARDPEKARNLWGWSAEATGVDYLNPK